MPVLYKKTTWKNKKSEKAKKYQELEIMRLSYCQDILNKRYDLYNWMDGKARISLTLNGLLLGLSYWLVNNHSTSVISKVLMNSGIVVLSVSMLVLLSVALPAMKSPVWKKMPEKLLKIV